MTVQTRCTASHTRGLRAIGLTALLLLLHQPELFAQEGERKPVRVPAGDTGVDSLASRRSAQLEAIKNLSVTHDFTFTDRLPESGITFRNLITQDNRKDMKATHYDHGNGLVVCDVDGDGLLDIYFLTQLGENELWKNLGNGRFENITEAAGVGLGDRVSVSAAFGDADNDGDRDLFVTTVKMGNVLFENDGKGRFRDVTETGGVGHVGHSSGAAFFDYDNDGLLDLFVTNVGRYTSDERGEDDYFIAFPDAFSGHLFDERTETSILYRNLGDLRFEDVSVTVGLVDGSWSGDVAPVDFNSDGFPDLYLPSMQGDDHYYENTAGAEGRVFVDKTAEVFPRTPWGTMGVQFFDYDNDGDADLYLTDMHSDMSREVGPEEEKFKSVMTWTDEHLEDGSNNIFGNAFYQNLGSGRFREVSDLLGVENYWPWGFTAADINADGWDDLFVASSMSFPFRYGINSLLLNDRGRRFVDSEFALGIEPRRDGRTHIPWFDLDCTGTAEDHFQCQGMTGPITILGTVGTRSSVAFDIEGDGDLDLVTNEFFDVPQVLVSDLAETHRVNSLEVALVGSRSNRDGFGALVRVHAGSRVLTRYHDGKSGYLSQSSMPLFFGLGDATQVDKIEVRWPSGTVQTVTEGIRLGARTTIEEPAPAPNSEPVD